MGNEVSEHIEAMPGVVNNDHGVCNQGVQVDTGFHRYTVTRSGSL